MLARRKAIAGAGSEPDGRFSGLTSGFARRSGDFALPDIFRAQRSLRSIRLGLGVATIRILTADHADCAGFLSSWTTRARDNKTRVINSPTVSHYKFRLRR